MYNQYQLVLATDLDGTFLEGDNEVKEFIYNQLLHLREQILLIYVTGRPVEIVERFCRLGYLPNPHFILGDHGTHIVDGQNFHIVEDIQNPIIQTWNNGNKLLKELLKSESGLQLQPLDPPYRVAYYYEAHDLQSSTIQKIIEAGYDAILSCDMYLDILPSGVNKGSTLLKLLDYLNVNRELAITAGDSLNDLALFKTGLKSIAVGNSEPKLIEEIEALNNVYLSKHAGLLGIVDGLNFFEKLHLFALNNAAQRLCISTT